MKPVILSADNELKVYAVPDAVAENLAGYCMEFCINWLHKSPHAEKYRLDNGAVCYDETDFIEYLNTRLFPEQPATMILNLGWPKGRKPIPAEFKRCPRFSF